MIIKRKLYTIYIIALVLSSLLLAEGAAAYWIWTPSIGRWINPKDAPKETPKEQFEYGYSSYQEKEYKKAISEFLKVIRSYPDSEYAPEAQFHIGRAYEDLEDYYKAYLEFQKVIDLYPYSKRAEEVIEHEYTIANLFFTGQKRKLLGIEILSSLDKAAEIFLKIVENAPYGKMVDVAQYKAGECYKKLERYPEAIEAFHKVIENYPGTPLVDDAKYQIALCSYEVSPESAYDQQMTEQALKGLEQFASEEVSSPESERMDEAILKLKEKNANHLYDIGYFYQSRKKPDSAKAYYQETIDKFPGTMAAKEAQKRIDALEGRASKALEDSDEKTKKSWWKIW